MLHCPFIKTIIKNNFLKKRRMRILGALIFLSFLAGNKNFNQGVKAENKWRMRI